MRGVEDSGLIVGLPDEGDGCVGDLDRTEVPDRRRQLRRALLEAGEHLPDVGETGGELRSG